MGFGWNRLVGWLWQWLEIAGNLWNCIFSFLGNYLGNYSPYENSRTHPYEDSVHPLES
jgi:hypothetical protein